MCKSNPSWKGMGALLILVTLVTASVGRSESQAESKPASKPARPTLAVVDFSIVGDVGIAQAGRAVSELLLQEFSTNRFTLLERSALAAILDEKDLSLSQVVENPNIVADKRLTDVHYLVVGSVVKLADLSISARIVDAGTGKIVARGKVSAENVRGLQDALGELAETLSTFGQVFNSVQLDMVSSVEGTLELDGTTMPVGQKIHAVFPDVPTTKPLKLIIRSQGKSETFEMNLAGVNSPKVYGGCYPSWAPLREVGSGVPALELITTSDTPGWTSAARQSAFTAATVDAVRRLGERAALQSFGKIEYTDNADGATITSATNVGGVLSSSHTTVRQRVTESDTIWLRVPQEASSRVISIRVQDFTMISPNPRDTQYLWDQLQQTIERHGITLETALDPKNYIAKTTATFHGVVIILDYRFGFN